MGEYPMGQVLRWAGINGRGTVLYTKHALER